MKLLPTLVASALGAFALHPTTADAQPSNYGYGYTPPPVLMPAEPPDGPRVRFGFAAVGGPMFALGADSAGGAAGVEARIGVQIDHLWGVYYQNTAWLGALVAGNSNEAIGLLMATDWNSIVGSVTLGHFFEIAVGPSLDVFAVAGCGASAAGTYCGNGTQAAFGIHSRLAFQLGTFRPMRPRRTGFSVAVEAHPMFVSPWPIMPVFLTLGTDWF